jgi:hypothetical protein
VLVEMTAAKPTARFTVTVSSAKGNGPDNITVELKAKSVAKTSAPAPGRRSPGTALAGA